MKGKKKCKLEFLISDKTKTLKSVVKALLEEIEKRNNLHQGLIQAIENQVSEQNSQIFNFQSIWPKYDWEKEQEFNQLKGSLEHEVLKLEQEKRNEEIECWRDLMNLQKDIMFALRDYWDLVQRRKALF